MRWLATRVYSKDGRNPEELTLPLRRKQRMKVLKRKKTHSVFVFKTPNFCLLSMEEELSK